MVLPRSSPDFGMPFFQLLVSGVGTFHSDVQPLKEKPHPNVFFFSGIFRPVDGKNPLDR